jgi:hypothetical protein
LSLNHGVQRLIAPHCASSENIKSVSRNVSKFRSTQNNINISDACKQVRFRPGHQPALLRSFGWRAHHRPIVRSGVGCPPSVVTTGPPDSPGIPARNGFNGLLRALPGDRALLSPSSADMVLSKARSGRPASAKLDAGIEASGPHDFAVRFSISRQHAVRSLTGLSTRPAITSRAQHCVRRIPFPTPVTIAKRPSVGRGRRELWI